MIVIRQYIIMV